jgi:hypothetical protein
LSAIERKGEMKYRLRMTSDDTLSRWNRDHLPHREKLMP